MEIIEARSEEQRMGDADRTQDPTTSIKSIFGAKLLNNVRKSNNENEFILDFSQIIDANGEPKIVEYSSWNDDFYTFDITEFAADESYNLYII